MSQSVRAEARFQKLRGEPKALLLISQGLTLNDVAGQVGVSDRTLRRRLRDPQYQARIGQLRADYMAEAVSKLAHASTTAVDTLIELATSANSETARLGAAKAILEYAVSVGENLEVRQRISALEEVLYSHSGDVKVRRQVTIDGPKIATPIGETA